MSGAHTTRKRHGLDWNPGSHGLITCWHEEEGHHESTWKIVDGLLLPSTKGEPSHLRIFPGLDWRTHCCNHHSFNNLILRNCASELQLKRQPPSIMFFTTCNIVAFLWSGKSSSFVPSPVPGRYNNWPTELSTQHFPGWILRKPSVCTIMPHREGYSKGGLPSRS